MGAAPSSAHPSARLEPTADAVIEITRCLAAELRAPGPARVTLDSRLELDLGLDSLARVELLARFEKTFGVALPERVLLNAETPRDLLRALTAAGVPTRRAAPARSTAPESADLAPPDNAHTLLEVLATHARVAAQRTHIYLLTDALQEECISYGELSDGADAVAAGLQARGVVPGETVALMLPTTSDYFFAFFGVLRAGGVPVPIYPPIRASQLEEHLRRHARILDNAQAVALITVPEARAVAWLFRSLAPSLRTIITVDELRRAHGAPQPVVTGAHDIAFLQYTSGSTGHPKGVVLTHANLLASIRAMGSVVQASSRDCFVSWMPLYHDMGLIGAWLASLYYGMPMVAMSPLTFLLHPREWLRAIHRHRATISGAPNFGYELCLRRIEDGEVEGLDLSSWRLAFNGAEPVSPETIARFSDRFAPYGFRPESMYPVFGLAECSLGLTFPPPGRAPVVDRIERATFVRQGHAVPASETDGNALRFVSCGKVLPEHEIRIVDATGFEADERREGRLQFKGPAATGGYYRNPEETARLFDGEWLDTGDLAYVADGELYVAGRVKDVIIRAGRNIYPHELEEAIGNLPGVRRGCVAVFGARAEGTERLVVLAETRETGAAVRERLRSAIAAVAIDLAGTAPDDVVLAPPHTVLKTSSGKLRRAASRELYERRRLGAHLAPPWWQIVRVVCAALVPALNRARRAAGELLYAGYSWVTFWLLAPATWVTVACLPSPPANRRVIRTVARLFLWLTGTRLSVQGIENIPRGQCILVANHASYIDGVVLSAVLPAAFSFAAKNEFARQFVPRVFLRRLGAEFVERFDTSESIAAAQRLIEAARRQHSLAIFPEGTFYRAPGLLPFHLGAFVAAVQTRLPVVPVALRGTRSLLRGDEWFPRHGRVTITVGEPIAPRGSGWSAAIRLRDAARAAILRHCGEPDLAT